MTTEEPTPIRKIMAPLARQLAESAAEQVGACVRPFAVRRIDNETGEKIVIPIPCGSTRTSVCPSCAVRAKRLRMHQAREGWHLTEEPRIETEEPTVHQQAMLGQIADLTEARAHADASGDTARSAALSAEIDQAEQVLRHNGIRGSMPTEENERQEEKPKRARSTRRRQDAPNLPRQKVADTTTGRVYEAPDGKTYRPSTFVTLTLPSYGRVHGDGTPVDPDSYDYRSAARDAIHFGSLVDRFWQNLRRAAGWNVQYFAAVEPQRRLAMHLHAAVRGTIPRKLMRQVAEATYHQVWWPEHDEPLYTNELPVWDEQAETYVDPHTGARLSTWDEAIEATFDQNARPAHVARFGHRGIDVQGVVGNSEKSGKCLGYLVKYLTKDIGEVYEPDSTRQRQHMDRLADTMRYQPCHETCANWLRYGIQPKNAKAGMVPGQCRRKAHRPTNLGYAGRRCLVSRKWSGRNLAEHRTQRREHVLRVLGAAGANVQQSTEEDPEGTRYRWEPIHTGDPDQPNRTDLLLRSIAQQRRWRHQYDQAKHSATETEGRAA
ncbi:replication initiator [Sciscionella sediminilitoris]|uniref:replication initiator n=1 Tax=Sciscionella sediminilitoris TaxID=1445613 RepID=UPI000B0D50AD|nr:replication initiator [Sciscionella sp. SE31]